MASLRKLVESSFVTYLDGLGLAASVYPGIGAETKDLPCVIVCAKSAQEAPHQSGNYNVSIEVSVKSSAADDTQDAHDVLCKAVGDAIWRDDIDSKIQTAEPGLRVFGASSPCQIAWDTDGDAWIETRTIEIHCCSAAQFTS